MVPEQPDRAHAPRGQITHRQHFNSPTLDASFWRSANYGTDGRAATMLQSIGGVATRQSSYTYDVRGFLTSRRDTSIGTTSICEGTPDPNYGGVLCSGAFSKTFNSRDSVAYDSVGNVRYVDGPAASGAHFRC